jgi:dTDP-4-amino-4,6-dideoxygalactose transaminase
LLEITLHECHNALKGLVEMSIQSAVSSAQTNATPQISKAVRTTPFAPWPSFEQDEIDAVRNVLASGKINYWTGPAGRLFETEYAQYVGTRYAVAVSNGTVALELALEALGVGAGDEVIVPSRTFLATASCVVMRGAIPVFADVDRNSQNITANTIRPLIGPRTRAVIVVHLAGWPCEMDPILELACEHSFKIIEDCAQAHGAMYKGRQVGSMGDIGTFSFCQDKIMTTGGEGGLITTNDEETWNRAWSFKDHGKSYDAVYNRQHPPGFRWIHESIGTNWRLTEMQSALGRVLLRKLPDRVQVRRKRASTLNELFAADPVVRLTVPPADCFHAYYKYYLFLRPEVLKMGSEYETIIQEVNAEGVPCFSGSCSEIYLEKAFPESWRPRVRHAVAMELGSTALMFLVHHTLTETDMASTHAAVTKVLNRYRR